MELSREATEHMTAELTAAIETRIAPALIDAVRQEAIDAALEAFTAIAGDTPGYVELMTEVTILREKVQALETENAELAAKLAVFRQQAQIVTHRVAGILSADKDAKKKVAGGPVAIHKPKKTETTGGKQPPKPSADGK
jgi:hypothetical protein